MYRDNTSTGNSSPLLQQYTTFLEDYTNKRSRSVTGTTEANTSETISSDAATRCSNAVSIPTNQDRRHFRQSLCQSRDFSQNICQNLQCIAQGKRAPKVSDVTQPRKSQMYSVTSTPYLLHREKYADDWFEALGVWCCRRYFLSDSSCWKVRKTKINCSEHFYKRDEENKGYDSKRTFLRHRKVHFFCVFCIDFALPHLQCSIDSKNSRWRSSCARRHTTSHQRGASDAGNCAVQSCVTRVRKSKYIWELICENYCTKRPNLQVKRRIEWSFLWIHILRPFLLHFVKKERRISGECKAAMFFVFRELL